MLRLITLLLQDSLAAQVQATQIEEAESKHGADSEFTTFLLFLLASYQPVSAETTHLRLGNPSKSLLAPRHLHLPSCSSVLKK